MHWLLKLLSDVFSENVVKASPRTQNKGGMPTYSRTPLKRGVMGTHQSGLN